MAQVRSATSEDGYVIRRYRPRDRSGFLSLYEAVWGRSKGPEWFDWRFDDNPYADRVEMIVAEQNGTLVGAEPLLPLPLATDAERVPTRQPVDWIVHPDHRRCGLFTRMTEQLLSTAAERAALLFNFPNDPLRPGLQKFDWTELGSVPTRYRVQRPERIVPDEDGTRYSAAATLARAGTPALQACLRAVDALTSRPTSITVDRVDGVDAAAVCAVYEDTRPEAIHIPREESFVEWRFANPRWETTTYVARRDGDPVATTVAATEQVGDSTIARLVDVQPMTTDPERAPAFEAALLALLDDHAAVDLIESPPTPFPGVFRRHGFLSDEQFPFERIATPTTHAVRPLSTDADVADVADALDCDVLDADNWLLTLGDRDVE